MSSGTVRSDYMSGELKRVESALTHDLNNVLQVIMGNLELLKRKNELVPEIIEAALQATRNAAALADRLGAIGRIRRQERRSVDVNRVLRDLEQLLERTVGDAVRIEMNLADNLPPAFADPQCIQLAVLELAANARAAMPAGGRLTFTTAAEGACVRIDVADSGCGMPPAAAEPTGLGLQIVKHCMALSEGRAEFRSTDLGTTVKLYVPFAK
jgi:signal transduction histidine kinase